MKRHFILFFKVFLLLHFTLTGQEKVDTLKIRPGDIEAARRIRRAELTDLIRPTWHLSIAEGFGMPFDPNGAIFKDGVYHLWYLYQAEQGHHWQHLSTIDLFHWRWHPNDLKHNVGDPEEGIFSGNAFLANDGNVVMAYHGLGTGGNCVAYSSDKNLNIWQKPKANPVVKPGWDPHMWVEGNKYYQISGGEPVSSGKPNPPVLYTGADYKQSLNRIGNFMTNDMPGVDWFEDVSCPDFFKLDDKWVLLCISHSRGARYYIGTWNGKQFKPESHHRMNWPGGTMFAPETLLDDKGRRIMWSWVLDRKSGVSSGNMSMPRVLTLSKDKRSLNIEPPKEIERLRYELSEEIGFQVNVGQDVTLKNISGNVMEMEITLDPGDAKRFGVKVLATPDGKEQTPIIVDRSKNLLQVDLSNSSLAKPEYNEFAMAFASPDPSKNPAVETQDAPFELKKGEKVHLRIFLDKSILEVFANGRQCITQVVYPTLNDAVHVKIFADDAPITVHSVKSWKLFPAMQW
jgi:beta-fructofuranosidase